MGSINGEWKAWETVSRCVLIPWAASCSVISSTASRLPEITTLAGPLTAAIETSPAYGASAVWIWASVAMSETIPPSAGKAPISRPRAATNFNPSSRLKIPATQAAAISPTLWPISRSG